VGELPAPSDSTESGAATGGSRVADRVQLSEAARLRASLRTEVGDPAASGMASERLAALQADVANQTYAPSPRAVADRLLGELAANLLS
jgi:anti-sigma28 factor (negative regulator of flagellin synthesis)